MSEICYGHRSPNAVFLPNYGPCNPQPDSVSLCCETGQTCLSNGLCVTQSGVYYNGGCTDSTYKAALCPTFCTSGRLCPVDMSLIKLMVVTGNANWVVECHGSAVKDGDFCCSVNGTTTTCCNDASNGLGLVAAVSSAQAVSATSIGAGTFQASVSTGIVPELISNGATTSSSGSILGSLSSTFLPTATSSSRVATGTPRSQKIEIGVIVPIGILTLLGAILYLLWWIKFHERRRPHTDVIPMGNRREGSDKSDSLGRPAEGVAPTEVDGSQVGGEAQGSPVGPIEMDANQTHVGPVNTPPSGIAAPNIAPDNNPLHEPRATPGSWYDPNLGNL